MNTPRERRGDHRTRIVRQALIGFAILVVGCVWGLVVVQHVGEEALDRDPKPIAGPLLVVGVGSIVMTIAAYRKLFRAPAAFLRNKAGDKVLEEISELLD